MWFERIKKYLLIDVKRLKDKRYLFFWFACLFFIIVYSLYISEKIRIDNDFTVFWMAGHNFATGAELYNRTGGASRYIYPPFAAMLFQFFSLFPLKTAAFIFMFVNFCLLLLIIGLTRQILSHFAIDGKKATIALISGVFLSFRFILYHIQFIQMNELMLVLCLAGINASLNGKTWLSGILIVLGVFIKILPIFFIPWLVLRSGYKMIFVLVSCCLLCILAPLLWRGEVAGFADIHNYYTAFLAPFQHGKVEAEFHNQSLGAVLYRIFLPTENGAGYNYQLWNLSPLSVSWLYKITLLILAGLSAGYLLWERFILHGNTLRGLALIFLCMHLLSGITWEYHLISLLFVYAVFMLYYQNTEAIILKVIFYSLLGLIIFISIVGEDTVGVVLYHYIEGYGIITWSMLLLFLFIYVVKLPNERVVALPIKMTENSKKKFANS